MRISRRQVMAGGLGAAALAMGSPLWAQSGFEAWVSGFRTRARAAGISAGTLDSTLPGLRFLPKVIELDQRQTEVAKPMQDYLASAASAGRIRNGQAALKKHAKTLAQIEKRTGVPGEIVVAIWGMESSFGGFRGTQPVLSVLATLAFEGRRDRFEDQLIAALTILDKGHARASDLKGSHAGAMGHTQFMPLTYLKHAVDGSGDGRADIWGDDPRDALASTANYLKAEGWVKGQPWGIEVALPDGFDPGLTGRVIRRKRDEWHKLGVRRTDGGKLPNHGPGGIILPAGPHGPAFLIWQNFQVLKAYNYADSYVIGVGHLSDRIAGGGAIRSGFPRNPWGMTTDQRLELQRRLNAAGFNAGTPDGVIGEKGRAAIRAYEASRGLRETGVPSVALLEALR